MPIRTIIISNDEYYHIYNRGNSKQIIFKDNHDKDRFVQLLSVMNQEGRKKIEDVPSHLVFDKFENPLVSIAAYVLMDNHFHILCKQTSDNGITKFMQKVCTAYVAYFNKKYARRGGLFEGNFKVKHVATDLYLQYLYAYIHLNPAKMVDKNWKENIKIKDKIITDFIKHYPYSSFHDYCGIKRPSNSIILESNHPIAFKTNKEFVENILKWISLPDINL